MDRTHANDRQCARDVGLVTTRTLTAMQPLIALIAMGHTRLNTPGTVWNGPSRKNLYTEI